MNADTVAAVVLLGVLALLPGTTLAQPLPSRYTVLNLERSAEALDNDNSDWTSTTFTAARHGRERSWLLGQWQSLQRFDVTDNQYLIGGYGAVGRRLGLTLAGSFSPDHRLVPENSVTGDLGLALNDAWTAHLGGTHSHFSQENATTLQTGIEFQRRPWRLGYTFSNGRLQSGKSGNSHSATSDWYYGQSNQIGVALGTGGQAIRIDPDTVVITDVRSAALAGRHWLSSVWGFSYSYGSTRQGEFYTRRGGSLGLLLRF